MNVSAILERTLPLRPPQRRTGGVRSAEADLRRTRLAQVLRYDTVANAAGLALLLGMYVTVTHHPAVLLLAALVGTHLLLDVWLYRWARSWDSVRVVAVCGAGIWAVIIPVTVIVPATLVIMTTAALFPAVLAVPYLTRRSLRAMVAGLVAVTTILTIASRYPSPSSVGQATPTWLVNATLIIFVPVMTGGIVLLLWHNNAWLHEALTATQDANQALNRSQQQVEEHATQLRASRERVVAAADTERRRMERDLHDGAQQFLVAAALTARRAQDLCQSDPCAAAELLDRVVAQLDRAAGELRNLAHGIYPAVLTEHGLVAALSLAAAQSPLPTRISAPTVNRYPASLEAAAYFCCLEALQNATKHAGPDTQITIRVAEVPASTGEHALVCTITDNGIGFDTEPRSRRTSGRGLTNMADRAAAAGGQITIDSNHGSGTTVSLHLPIAKAATGPATSTA